METGRNESEGQSNFSHTGDVERAKSHIIVEIIEYVPNAVVSKTIIKKSTGNITAMAVYKGEELAEKMTPFDTYVQIIHGSAHVTIDDKEHHLALGTGIIVPANSLHYFRANEQFKMISTIIKHTYEEHHSN